MTNTSGIRLRSQELTRYIKIAWVQVAAGLLLAGVSGAQIIARMYQPTRGDVVLIGLAAGQTVCGVGLAATGLLYRHVLRTACILLTADGVINRQVRDRLIPWHTITAVETTRRGGNWRVRLAMSNGRRALLAAPLTRVSAPDPGFATDRDTLVEWWRRHVR